MSPSPRRTVAIAGATATLVLLAGAALASAPAAAATGPGEPSPPDSLRRAAQPDTLTTDGLRLRLAAFEHARGNAAGVVRALAPIDFRAAAFAGADRAAFLLGAAYLQFGAYAEFSSLAEDLTHWTVQSPYMRWIAFQGALLRARAGDQETARGLLASGSAAAEAQALSLYARALTTKDAGGDATSLWAELSRQPANSDLLRTLVGAALVQLATDALERGTDPVPLLDRVPPGSRFAPRARHMRGLLALERGDAEGVRILEALLADTPEYPARREVWQALAGRALDEQRWEDAFGLYGRADAEWTEQTDEWRAILTRRDFASLWRDWENENPLSDALLLDAGPAQDAAARLALEATDLRTAAKELPPALGAAPGQAGGGAGVPPPAGEARDSVVAAAGTVSEARFALERNRWEQTWERAQAEDWVRYLKYGDLRLERETSATRSRAPSADTLAKRVDATLAGLDAAHRASIKYVQGRTKRIRDEVARQRLWLRAMEHFYLKGPNGEDFNLVPANTPTAAELVQVELAFLDAMDGTTASLDAGTPRLLADVLTWARGLGLPGRAAGQRAQLKNDLLWAGALAHSVDSSLAAGATNERLRQLAAEESRLEANLSAVTTVHDALRDRVAQGAVETALQSLDGEREGIDYGLAAAAYGRSIQMSRASGAEAPEAELDAPEFAAWRDRGIALHRSFLEKHTESPARGETRFRLADLLLVDARLDFRRDMAHYVRTQSSGGRTALPVLDYAPALELYERMLAEDPGFPHRDAVLFNAGMILTESADPRAARHFQDLVASDPESPMAQEAYLRLGDIEFNERRFAACVPLYERSAAGADTGLRIIAVYKLGWAQFNEDRFLESADAFRTVLDLYDAAPAASGKVDVRDEAESYLIHTLARAGGAPAFAEYFDRIGPRSYEMDLLLAMGQHFRRFSLFEDAAAVDRLHIERAPHSPEALVSAERLTETYRRWDHPEQAREAARELAPRFAPGGDWARAQTSDSLRQAGAAFARESWAMLADHHHRAGLDKDDAHEWEEALSQYRTILETWPEDEQRALLSLRAGEACHHLAQYETAMAYFDATVKTGADSLPEIALRQRVATADAWYDGTRVAGGAGGPEGLGAEEQARTVLAAGDDLLSAYPRHEGAGDVLWRQGNLSFAHGWYERAATDLGRLHDEHPADGRAPDAAGLRADALFRLERYGEAGEAFESARLAAVRAGRDTLAAKALAAIPVCHYRAAEAAVAADSANHRRHAELFAFVAAGWPEFEHAQLAEYRAGLSFAQAGDMAASESSLRSLVERHPEGEYAKDAYLQIATNWEKQGAPERAAQAYLDFAEKFPGDESADDALLKAGDLFAAAGQSHEADEARLEYARRYPEDLETVAGIREEFARRELAGVQAGRPISSLLAGPRRRDETEGDSHLAEYVRWAAENPGHASPALLAEVRYLEAEETRPPYEALHLTLPLKKSLASKQKLLDALVARYRGCIDLGVAEWAHASAFRIGQAIVGFGAALQGSEKPRDLRGDDLLAYDEVLADEAQAFYDRGEAVWADLLREASARDSADTWVTQARAELWPRLARRFLFHPEVEFPTVAASGPATQSGGGSAKAGQGDAIREGEEGGYARGGGGVK